MVAARLEEVIDGVVGSVRRIEQTSGCSADGRASAGDIGAAISHGVEMNES